MQIIGHRGAKGLAPENTILAIRVAIREKVDMIEIDVQLKGKTLVLSHDPVVEGKKYTTLHTALEKIHGKTPLNIEIKEQKAVKPAKIVAAIKKELSGYKGRVVISCYNYKILLEVRHSMPKAEIAVLEKWSGVRAVAKASLLKTKRIHMNQKSLWSGFVRSMKHSGYELHAYTVNLSDRADELESWGVDGIFTDYPSLFR